jgi:superfamily II DNA or RNA helicase
MSLRPYQRDLIARVQSAYRDGARSVLMQLPCGGGKTSTAAGGVIAPSVARGRRVVFVADLEELIDDTAERLRALNLPVGVVKAGRAADPTAPVQVCSLQTLARRAGDLPPGDRVILDEAHIAGARTVRDVLAHYRDGLVLGLSATPSRGDGQPLDEFDRIVCGPQVSELVALGALMRPIVYAPERVLERGIARDPVDLVLSERADRRCVIFAQTGAEADRIAGDLTAAGHNTIAVLTGMDRIERRGVRARLESGEVRSLATVRALQKGFDAPMLDCAILTTLGSEVSTIQSEGRVMRPCVGKPDPIVDDLKGATWLWGLPDDDRVWSLEGAQGRPGIGRFATNASMLGGSTRWPTWTRRSGDIAGWGRRWATGWRTLCEKCLRRRWTATRSTATSGRRRAWWRVWNLRREGVRGERAGGSKARPD